MLRSNKPLPTRSLAALASGGRRLLLGLSLLLVAAACSTTPNSIGVGLPTADANTGAYLVDTLTIRASTVLRDSVITSGSNYLLVGRYTDPQLGTITAKSYATLTLGGTFALDQSQVYDSLVLVLKPDAYRYGDTTKTQTLVEVRRLKAFVPSTQYGYASPKLTPTSGLLGANVNEDQTPNLKSLIRRARPTLRNLRIRLNSTFGQELLEAGKKRLLNSQEQLDALYPGLALLPGATDDAALVRFGATTEGTALILYYHDPVDRSTALSYSFSLSTGRHFYQAEADRSAIAGLNMLTMKGVDAAFTTQQTYIQGLLGLQTKLEIPYLTNLRSFGQHLIITNAVMTAEIPTTTTGLNLPPPAALALYTTDQNNHLGTLVPTTNISSTGTNANSFGYLPAVTSLDGFDQPGYTWSILTYCQAVLSNQTQNTGLLLNTTTPALPERVVLGGPKRATNRLRLRIYLISNN